MNVILYRARRGTSVSFRRPPNVIRGTAEVYQISRKYHQISPNITQSLPKLQNISASNDAKTIGIWQARCTLRNAPHDAYFDVAIATVFLPVSFCCKSNAACLTV